MLYDQMSAFAIAICVFVGILVAAAAGLTLRALLPEENLNADSRDVIKAATAVVATLSALALGLLIASAKTAFDGADTELRTSVGQLLQLDHVMEEYGPETVGIREDLRHVVEARLQHLWNGSGDEELMADQTLIGNVQRDPRRLAPQTDVRHSLQARALDLSEQLSEADWLVIEMRGEGLPSAFLAVLGFWIALLFFTFGLLAPRNQIVCWILVSCAVSVAAAVFLVIDMAHPYLGLVYISDAPLRAALEHLGR